MLRQKLEKQIYNELNKYLNPDIRDNIFEMVEKLKELEE